MGVRLARFPEYGVTMEVFSGALTPELLFERLCSLRKGDGARWIIDFDPSVDLSLVDVASIPELRRANAARLRALGIDDPRIAFVCDPGVNAPLFDFWLRYVQLSGGYPGAQALFSDLKAACDWLDLPDGACATLTEVVEARTAVGLGGRAAPEAGPPERPL